MDFEKIHIEKYVFLKLKLKNANFVFSTAENNLNFNKNKKEGKENLNNIKKWFDVGEVSYLNQIHSNIVRNHKEECREGDSIVTNKFNIAVGVFTADCVPILLYDMKNHVVSAVHSGWRGTYNKIVINTIENMKQKYETEEKDIIACIGPHIKSCCYEVSPDLIDKFKNEKIYNGYEISNKRNLNLEKCISAQLNSIGVDKENIITLDLCTFCNNDPRFYSYRKVGDLGRQFSFVYLNK